MQNILLINISGEDRPGITSMVTGILAAHGINVLDIGQAVIHSHLSLGLLVEIPEERETPAALKDLLFRIHEAGLQVRYTPISAESYREWVAGQGKPRHIVTLLSRRLRGEEIARLTTIVARHGLNIDKITRLSGRVSLDAAGAADRACVEFSVRGDLADAAAVRRDFLELASELGVDIAYQEDNMFRRNRRLVAFDMDSTLIEAEVIDELAKRAGVGAEVAAITERAMRGEIDFCESFRRRVALLEGLDEAVLEDVAAELRLSEGAEKLVSTLRRIGLRTAIISGGFGYFGRRLQQRLGIDYVFANELDIADGRVTGRVVGPIVDGARKAGLLREIAAREGISLEQVIAVGDGANDLPMLSIAGLGIAFRAKPIVKESAQHAISTLGLDGILYLLGISDRETGGL
ncbi:MAG: Phosphoserine phosphatase SerB2 [Pseudomonadales bacterium]|nr:Phosphoserine phosphatase SerB2 [Pseudomonadales bacterium]